MEGSTLSVVKPLQICVDHKIQNAQRIFPNVVHASGNSAYELDNCVSLWAEWSGYFPRFW